MATPTLCGQVAEKWQNSFARLNRGEPEISGFISFSEVRLFIQLDDHDSQVLNAGMDTGKSLSLSTNFGGVS